MKWLLIPLFVLMMPIAMALTDTCETTLNPGQNCTMLTPTLVCTVYNYTIYNTTDAVVNHTLGLMEGSEDIYYLNFSQGTGDYIVELCDGSTREIYVEAGESMYIAIMIALCGFAILFIAAGVYLFMRRSKNER